MNWPDNVAFLEITSWVGYSAGAKHVYGKLYISGERRIQVTKLLMQEDVDILNKEEHESGFYIEGDETRRFISMNNLIYHTINMLKKQYPNVELLLERDDSSLSVHRALWGIDKEVVDNINVLYIEADKELDWYSGKNDQRMEEIDKEFWEIINKVGNKIKTI